MLRGSLRWAGRTGLKVGQESATLAAVFPCLRSSLVVYKAHILRTLRGPAMRLPIAQLLRANHRWFFILGLAATLCAGGSAFAQCLDEDADGYGRPGSVSCSGGAQADCNDSDALQYPGAPEVCDGRDNDCNGAIDDAPACDLVCDLPDRLGPISRVTDIDGFAIRPRAAWNGSTYGVVWQDDPRNGSGADLRFVQTDGAGQPVGAESEVYESDRGVVSVDMVWTGSEYGVVWAEERVSNQRNEIYFIRLDAAGAPIGADIAVTAPDLIDSREPSISWNGLEYGVAWTDERGSPVLTDIYFARLDRQGNKIGSSRLYPDQSGRSPGGHRLDRLGVRHRLAVRVPARW